MNDAQAQRDRRFNHVHGDLNVVLRRLLPDVPFITEKTLHGKYLQLCGEELKRGLDSIGMTLYDLVELKFAESFVAFRDGEMPGLLRRRFVDRRAVLAADASRKAAGLQKPGPGAVSEDSHDADLADAAVAADDASADGPAEPKHASIGQPEEHVEEVCDEGSRSGPEVIRVGRKARVLSYFEAAALLGSTKLPRKNLERTRGLLRKRQGSTGRVALNVFDFHLLIKNEGTFTHAAYAIQKTTRTKWTKIAYHRLSVGLKGLRTRCVHDTDRVYTIRKVCRVSSANHYVRDKQKGHISVKDLFHAKYGVRLEHPRLPVVAVHSPDGRREFLPMECVQVVENKKLLFVSILAARASTIGAVPKKPKRRRRRSQGANVGVNQAQ